MMLIDSLTKRLHLHLSESQRVMVAFPEFPVHTVTERGVAAVQVKTVQVGSMTVVVPPGTFAQHCTRASKRIVVLVSSAELVSEMAWQWITFNTDEFHKNVTSWLYKNTLFVYIVKLYGWRDIRTHIALIFTRHAVLWHGVTLIKRVETRHILLIFQKLYPQFE